MIDGIGRGLGEAFFMFWETLWALVLGFVLSGAVQAFVSRGRMQRVLGDHTPAALGRASFFGVVSSSCSYAAAALAKTLFARGADFTAAMVFMIASTNLVVELGLVLWLLLGWQFALAEFVGGAIMIVLLGLVLPRVIPVRWLESARHQLNGGAPETATARHDPHGHAGHDHDASPTDQPSRTWGDAAGYTISDLTMLRKELVIGFVVAGFASALVPTTVWQSLFISGHGFWSSLENVIVGPFLAIISFVCSVGNVPLGAALWSGGISFGGVVAFVFADLISFPLLVIYRRYYGTAITLRLLGVFWATMAVAGLATEYLFKAVGITDPLRHRDIAPMHFSWNYTSILNIVAIIGFAVVYWLYRHRDVDAGTYAKDPICGMQVEIAHAPAVRTRNGEKTYFCSDHCAHKFDNQHSDTPAPVASPADTAIDPVCQMTVDKAHAAATAEVDGTLYWFCNVGCRESFVAHPDQYLRAPTVPEGRPLLNLLGGSTPARRPSDHDCACGGHDDQHH